MNCNWHRFGGGQIGYNLQSELALGLEPLPGYRSAGSRTLSARRDFYAPVGVIQYSRVRCPSSLNQKLDWFGSSVPSRRFGEPESPAVRHRRSRLWRCENQRPTIAGLGTATKQHQSWLDGCGWRRGCHRWQLDSEARIPLHGSRPNSGTLRPRLAPLAAASSPATTTRALRHILRVGVNYRFGRSSRAITEFLFTLKNLSPASCGLSVLGPSIFTNARRT